MKMNSSILRFCVSKLCNKKEINKQGKEELVKNLNEKKDKNICKEMISDCPFPNHY
jgi:hypothetical protein